LSESAFPCGGFWIAPRSGDISVEGNMTLTKPGLARLRDYFKTINEAESYIMNIRNNSRTLVKLLVAVAIAWSLSYIETGAQTKTIVSNFLNAYSNSLLNGTYEEHADLFTNPTNFEGKTYNRAAMRKLVKKFYSNYITLAHRFSNTSYSTSDNGRTIFIWTTETHKIKNRKTGKVSSVSVYKFMELKNKNGWKCSTKDDVPQETEGC